MGEYIVAWGYPFDTKKAEKLTNRLHDFLMEPFALLPFNPNILGRPFQRYAVAMLLALELATVVPAWEPQEE